jgi:phosphate transport system substrate-binding protein
VHRADGSGTTSNFTSYLTKAAPTVWTLGADKTVPWPAGQRAENGNAGVAQAVTSTEGSIGYVDYSDAKAAGLVFAEIENKAGKFVAPTLESATAALAGVTLAPDLTYDPLDAAGASAYPITAPTYVLAYENQTDHAAGVALKGYLTYLLSEGQDLAESVDFARLPDSILSKARAQVEQVKVPA